MTRLSHTAVVERNASWSGAFATEPYEAAWASEAIFFVRTLEPGYAGLWAAAKVQISPDGMHWCDEGTVAALPGEPGIAFCRVREFGGWLRLVGEIGAGATLTVAVYLVLKE